MIREEKIVLTHVLKIGTLKRTCVYCDLQAKRDECGYVI